MENNFETKYKPLGTRLFAVLTAFIAGLTFVGDPAFSAKAEEMPAEIVGELLGDESIPEYSFDETDDVIVDDFPEVTASYVPMSDEEQAEITKALFISNMKEVDLKDGETGFVQISDSGDIAEQSMKTYILQYVFTSSEQQEGDTAHYIERSDNFIIKGKITVNTEHILEAGHMEFRLPRHLLQQRNGGYCEISSVAVGEFPVIPVKDENGIYQIGENYSPSMAVFNYYIDNETDEYVFINYGTLTSNAAVVEVSYNKVDVFEVRDSTEWSIKPSAKLVYFIEKTGHLYVNGSPVLDVGGEPLYLTQCMCNDEYLYMSSAEEDTSKNKRIVYYDSNGNPKYVYENSKNWYSITGVEGVHSAEWLVTGRDPMTEDFPVITVCYDTEEVNREIDNGISGKIKTDVTLDSVTKYPESNNSSGYGAQLYTKGQMSKYINVNNLPSEVLSGNKLSDDYIYTCWRVYTKGTCTQPWSMLLQETPKAASFVSGTAEVVKDGSGNIVYNDVPGAIVLGVSTMLPNSYSKRTDSKVGSNSSDITRLKSYVDIDNWSEMGDWWYVADTNTEMRGSFGLQSVIKEHKFNLGYYVVVAYPRNELSSYGDGESEQYPPLKNEVIVHLYSRDDAVDQYAGSVSNDNIVYKKFEWKGGEYYVHTYKRVDGECKDGLLSVYDNLAAEPGADGYIGDIWFHESYRIGGYKCCHNTKDYSYEEGKYYKVVNTDDVLTAQPYGEVKYNGEIKRVYGVPKVLDGSDYFYSKAVLTISEFEVDPYEDYVYALDDEAAAQKILPDNSKNRDWIVYGWYEDSSDWVPIDLTKYGCEHSTLSVQDYVKMRGKSDQLKITFNFKDKGEKCPYRLKVEHNSIAYNTRMNWDLETQLKLDSSTLNETGIRSKMYFDDGTPVTSGATYEMFRISLRNYSATKSTVYDEKKGGVQGDMIDHYDNGGGTYQNIAGLADRTLVNANRYQFVDMSKFYSGGPLYRQKDNLTKSALGTKLLETEGTLESPYGISEYLPLKYINGDQTFGSLNDFVEANRHVYRDHAAIDISILENDARADKFASWENDTQNGQVIMTYTISGYEGYKLSKELRPLIESMGVAAPPQRQKVILYDLLPYGVNYYGFEEPIAGKLTTTQIGDPDAESISYDDVDEFVDTWDNSKIKITKIDVKENWNDSGRTMVAFTVDFRDNNAIMTDSNWFVGCGIRFKGYVSWDNYGPAREKDNIFAYTVEETDDKNGGNLYGKFTGTNESQVYDGAGTYVPNTVSSADYSPFEGETLDHTKGTPDARNRLYGHANDMENITMARTIGIKKLVRADKNTYAEYEKEIGVPKGEDYTYKIHIDKSAQGAVGNVVIFDNVERMSDEHYGGHGVFHGVDLNEVFLKFSGLESQTTIWYSESRNAPKVLYGTPGAYSLTGDESEIAEWSFEEANNLSTDKWVKSSEYVGRTEDVKSIAIDFGDHVFEGEAIINVYIKIKAPTGDEKFALNQASYYFHDYKKSGDDYVLSTEEGAYEYSNSEITAVTYGDRKTLNIVKNVIGKFPEEVAEQFTFIVTSKLYYYNSSTDEASKDYDFSNIGYKLFKKGESEDDKLIHATNSNGEFTLNGGEKAEFSEVPSVSALGGAAAGYDFDNYRIIEKSAPYFLSVESVSSGGTETATFNNYYRPVIYLTKKTKGVPEGVVPDDTEFSYRIKIYDNMSSTPDVPITFSDAEGGYKLLSKTGSVDAIRSDNTLYWYKVYGSAGWYDIPNGWKIKNDSSSLYNTTGSAFDLSDSSFTVTFDTNTTNTVAVPIYIQHKVSGEDVGMLYEEDGELKARYRFEIEKVPEDDWYCSSPKSGKYSGELGTGENSFIWTNNYMYKELLVKKTVTHAPSASALADRTFTFKLTKGDDPYHEYKSGRSVAWNLCKMSPQGEITPLTGEGKSGTVGADGVFAVKDCGNPADSTGDVYVIKLSYLKLDEGGKDTKFTVSEIELNSDYRALKESDTVTVKGNSVITNANIENDYLKRDITVRKIVAASTIPSGDKAFTMVLCREGADSLPGSNLTGKVIGKDGKSGVNITAVPASAPAYGWTFNIHEGESVTFEDIGKAGDKYYLYEKYDSDYQPLSLNYDTGDYTNAQAIELPYDNDYTTDVVNGADGYMVLRKRFTGSDINDISDALDEDTLTVAIKLRKTDGTYLDDLDADGNITVGGDPAANINSIQFKRTDNVIINMNGLKTAAAGYGISLDGTFTVAETGYSHQLENSGSWYVIEPAHSDAMWEFGADTKQAVIVNNVTKFDSGNVIYKRIGFRDNNVEPPTGAISFTVKDSTGTPVQGVKCMVAKYDSSGVTEEFTGYGCVSDENGIISIDFSNDKIKNSGWVSTSQNMQYFLKLYFDREVRINPTGSKLSITENTIATDKSWGAPAGYEISSSEDSYVNERLLKKGETTHWTIKNADTFVNTQDTEKVAFTKSVTSMAEGDKDTMFSFVVSEFVGSGYQPAPHISYAVYGKDDTEMTTPVRTGVTDLAEDDPNTGWGVFTLKSGEKAVIELPKNAYWQVSEDNTGKYKLVTDNDDNITSGESDSALYADTDSQTAYGAKYIAQGFEFHTTLDMLSGYIEGDDLVIINGVAAAGAPMFSKYVESEDSPNDADGIYRTHTRNGEDANYYYSASDSTAKYNNPEYIISDMAFYSTGDAALVHDGTNGLVWNSTGGTAAAYKGSEVVLPDKVYSFVGEKVISHRIVGIGKNAYNGNTGINTVIMPKYVEKIGDNAFKGCTNLRDVIWYGATIASYGGSYPNKYYVTYSDPEDGFGVKVLGAYSLCSTSVDVVLPPTVVTIEAGVFKDYKTNKYGDNKWRNAPPANGVTRANAKYVYKFGEMLPSTLRYFALNDSGLSDEALGKGAYSVNGNLEIYAGTSGTSSYSNTSQRFIPFVIGSGDSISELKTSFNVIGSSTIENDVGVLRMNSFHYQPMRWPTIVIGKNENGITVKSEFNEQFGKHNAAYEGQVIVFPKGQLTLEENCLKNNNGKTYLRILQTDNLADLRVEGFVNDTISSNTKTIYVFTNLTQAQVEGSTQYTNLKSGGSDSKVQFYYKDTISGHYDDIIRGVDMSVNFWNADVRAMLKELAGPGTLPAPRHLTASENIITHKDIYLEKKKELLD
ncbi:MAG: leucine-rich repeat domain-containing protein [Ruminococcus sp.]|uniref:leucine-rich repeat protein n=1 Tax=Ruminococcus sp. TaxID=41978 RepID=UPI0025D917AF|nr:leucine-rich repeat protein [Ruminococcus sp.]MCR5600167.1 leucine-rich repeat domain-containing protein [Ruminococcus sp.]